MIALIIFLTGLSLGLAFHAHRSRQIRRALFAACTQRDIEIQARGKADLKVARLTDKLGAARRLQMEQAAEIEAQDALIVLQGKKLDLANSTISSLYAKVRSNNDLNIGGTAPLPAAAIASNGSVPNRSLYVRQTGTLVR